MPDENNVPVQAPPQSETPQSPSSTVPPPAPADSNIGSSSYSEGPVETFTINSPILPVKEG